MTIGWGPIDLMAAPLSCIFTICSRMTYLIIFDTSSYKVANYVNLPGKDITCNELNSLEHKTCDILAAER